MTTEYHIPVDDMIVCCNEKYKKKTHRSWDLGVLHNTRVYTCTRLNKRSGNPSAGPGNVDVSVKGRLGSWPPWRVESNPLYAEIPVMTLTIVCKRSISFKTLKMHQPDASLFDQIGLNGYKKHSNV